MTKPMSERAPGSSGSNENQDVQQLVDSGLSLRAAKAILAIDATMTHIRRSMAQRELGRMALRDLGLDIDIPDLELISVLAPGGCYNVGDEVTVGTVATRLGVDPSRASRVVADGVEKGIVRRVASQGDARKICLELTDKGRACGHAITHYKSQIFAGALKEWPEDELVEFARLFERFSQWVAEAKNRSGA